MSKEVNFESLRIKAVPNGTLLAELPPRLFGGFFTEAEARQHLKYIVKFKDSKPDNIEYWWCQDGKRLRFQGKFSDIYIIYEEIMLIGVDTETGLELCP